MITADTLSVSFVDHVLSPIVVCSHGILPVSYEGRTLTVPILQMRELRPRAGQELAQKPRSS